MEQNASHGELPVRDRLLNAAEAVVERDGVSNLTLETVAREAGVSKGGLLYHFPSKSALITAVVERLAGRCEVEQAEAMEKDPQRVGAFARAYVTARAVPLEPSKTLIHTALLAAAGTNPQYLDPFRKRLAGWQQRIESDGVDPVAATVVRLAMDGLVLLTLLGLPTPSGDLHDKVIDKLYSLTQEQEGAREGSP